jgi:multicomponent Na+:H+ antiporter subunit A
LVYFATGSRDVTRLEGLGRILWPVAIAGFLAAISNGGVIPTVGFISKDIVYEATTGSPSGATLFTVLAIFTNICLMVAGLVVGIKPFLGKIPYAFDKITLPNPIQWIPPLLLAILGIILGLAPGLIDDRIIMPVLDGLQVDRSTLYIKLWHGFNTVLLLSTITIVSGLVLYFIMKPSTAREQMMEKLNFAAPETLAVDGSHLLNRAASFYTRMMQSGYLRRYIRIIIVFLTLLVGLQFLNSPSVSFTLKKITEVTFYETVILVLMLLGTMITVSTNSRLGAIAAMGVVGYSICLLFVFFSAPDLAMTQFSIETLTVILFVLVLFKLPKYVQVSTRNQIIGDWMIALVFGGLITMIALTVIAEGGPKEVGAYHAANAYLKAKGKNIVNVILVDFRGIDTLIEIIVLTIAAIGVFGLMKLRMKDK